MFDFLLCNAWLFLGIWVGCGNAWFWRCRASRLAENEEALKEQMNLWARGSLLWMALPAIFLWLIQRSGGIYNPFFDEWPRPQYWFGVLVISTCWAMLLGWVWAGRGARTISEMNRTWARSYTLTNLVAIRLLVTASVFAGMTSLAPSFVENLLLD